MKIHIHIDDNGSDMLTKTLPIDRLRVFRQRTGLADSAHTSEGREGEEQFTLVKIHIHTDDNGSDMLTKTLPMDRLRVCRQRTGLADSAHTSEGRVC